MRRPPDTLPSACAALVRLDEAAAADPRPLEGPDADAELVLLARAIGHPIRLQIIRFLLRSGGCHVGRLRIDGPLGASTMSQHIKVLKQAGLIRADLPGALTYCINERAVRRLRSLIAML
jgi:ArsR family transcriptional regulator